MMSAEEHTSAVSKQARRGRGAGSGRVAGGDSTSSPVRSGDERGLPSFGEPSRVKAPVKVTYAAKKSKSPVKGSPAQKGTPRHASKTAASTPTASPRTPRAQAFRKRAQKTTNSAKVRRPSLSKTNKPPVRYHTISDSSDIEILDGPPASASTFRSNKRGEPVTTLKQKQVQTSRKRKLSPGHSDELDEDGAASDLTPLSSPEPEEQNPISNGHASLSTSSLSTLSRSVSPASTHDASSSGSLVWVRLNASGTVEASKESMWWPAKVTSSLPLKVLPFGRPPGVRSVSAQELRIVQPSKRFVLPMLAESDNIRFNERTYTDAGRLEDLIASPRKRQKIIGESLLEQWKEARDQMLQAYQDDNDGFPLMLSFYQSTSPPKPSTQSRLKDSISDAEEDEPFYDPGPNPLWEIPGELVLAKDKRHGTQYWPAKVMRYFERRRPNDKEKYEVLYFDKTSKVITREMIVTPNDDDFATCTMGDSADNYGLDLEKTSGDQDDLEPRPDEVLDENILRAPSPVAEIPITAVSFVQLEIPQQFEYTKPVLSALLSGQYLPGKERHLQFMKGGRSREQANESAWQRGDLSHKDKEELSMCIRRWMRRRERRQELGLVPYDVQVELPDQASVVIGSSQDAYKPQAEAPEGIVGATEPPGSQASSNGTEHMALSAAEGPPTSLATASTAEDNDFDGVNGERGEHEVPTDGQPERQLHEIDQQKASCDTSRKHAADERLLPSESTTRKLPTYAMLSKLDQISYCTSVLLPEAILQLLLWRNGLRGAVDLLSPVEEGALHTKAKELAEATYWVHDIIYLKRSAARALLPPDQDDFPMEDSSTGRTRRKTRRG